MKINLKDLEPNPYRDLKRYPVKQERVEALKASINQTGFWDNVLARPFGEKYQLAYGHNRREALTQLGIEEIDIPVKNISDADMVRIMATENREQYEDNQSVLIETVQTVKRYLDEEIGKIQDFNNMGYEFKPHLFDNEKSFNTVKEQGVGINTVLRFLGDGWKRWKIAHALSVINSNDINIEAVKKIESTGMSEAFTRAIKQVSKETGKAVDFEEQERIAEELSSAKHDKSNKITGKSGGGDYYGAIIETVKDKVYPSFDRVKPKETKEPKIQKVTDKIAIVRNSGELFLNELNDLISLQSELSKESFENVQFGLLIMTIEVMENKISKFKNQLK